MNLQFYLEKLNASNELKDFLKENPEAFLCSGFIVLDKVGKDNKIHFDYFLPKEKKIMSFQLESGVKVIPVEWINKGVPEKISIDYDFEFSDMEDLIVKKMEEEKINNKIQNIIFSLQKVNGKDFLAGTVFISMLGMIQVKIDLPEKKISEFEKKSLMDVLKVVKRVEKKK